MTAPIHTISEVNQRAKDALIREIGVVDSIRFLNQFRIGSGNYTAERESLFEGTTVKEIIADIKSRRADRT
ncbi:hypothetical protein [Thiocapsa rosea]|uniref:Uncharacterized protein n=1 Tax=Thiocapsa rosea TaxID=69360 RepID=A0A495VE03_9GAMM|nr:hypothetical protein [Thiocapsa rosea]RKT46843.1 hypothetical protein BDD21_4383 [Thiocapsa rosea]